MPTVLSSKRRQFWRRSFEFAAVVGLGAGIVLTYHYAQQSVSLGDAFARFIDRPAPPASEATIYRGGQRTDTGCNIKGNVSINTGERIYHVPGQKFYDATRINSRYGERWFCSEEEARKAGWRKARR